MSLLNVLTDERRCGWTWRIGEEVMSCGLGGGHTGYCHKVWLVEEITFEQAARGLRRVLTNETTTNAK
jgi:hypothetical protein